MWRMYIREHDTIGPWVRKVESQPSWVTKAAVVTAALVVGIPLLALATVAVLLGLAVFMVLGLVAAGVGTLQSLFTGGASSGEARKPGPQPSVDDGRRNVRISQR